MVSVGFLSGSRQPDPSPRGRSHPPHRGLHERAPGRLLLGRQDAGARCPAVARRPLAGRPGRRGPRRRRGHCRPDRRFFRQRQRRQRPGGLRPARFRPRRLDLRRKGHRGHRQSGALSLSALADPGQQRRPRRRGRFHRRPDPDRLRHHEDHPEPGPEADRPARRALLRRSRHPARRLLLPGRGGRHHAGLCHVSGRVDARRKA